MRLSEFDYDLPERLIAQEPLERRDASRLMVLDRGGSLPAHRRFTELPDLLRAGDLLVLNDTRVVPARLRGRRRAPAASASVDALLVERIGPAPGGGERWRAMLKGACRPGGAIDFGRGLSGRLEGRGADGMALIDLSASAEAGGLSGALERAGLMPTPPYIKRRPEPGATDPREAADRERYQTVFAKRPGALAAPTAGLHFTWDLLEAIRARGVEVESLTLHVGLGTFLPVRTEPVERHRLQPEEFIVPQAVARAVARARGRGCRVVAAGTTVTRALEASAEGEGGVREGKGRCDLFILPGHRFRVVDALVTNFHLPRSTLLMLASAFAGRERILAAYAEAIRRDYRFYSYGDAMLLE